MYETKVEVLPVETIEVSGEVTVATQNRDGIVKTIARQIEAVKGAELRSTFEKLKLGAMVKQAVTLLGLEGRGNGHAGDGVKGWWDENFKDASGQPVIPYRTLMNWIAAAEKIPQIMGKGGVMERDKVLALLAKDPEQVISKSDRKFLESAEKVSKGMTMRQMLLWGDDAEPRHAGRPKGSGAADEVRKAKTAAEKAADAEHEMRELIGALGAFLTRGGKVQMLSDAAKSDFHRSLVDYAEVLAELI